MRAPRRSSRRCCRRLRSMRPAAARRSRRAQMLPRHGSSSSSNRQASSVAMQFFLLGLAALLLSLLVLRGFTMANPHVLVGQLRTGAGIAALVGAGFLVLRGLVGYAVSLAALGSWLLWGRPAAPWGGTDDAQRSGGQSSRVATEHLEVEL